MFFADIGHKYQFNGKHKKKNSLMELDSHIVNGDMLSFVHVCYYSPWTKADQLIFFCFGDGGLGQRKEFKEIPHTKLE